MEMQERLQKMSDTIYFLLFYIKNSPDKQGEFLYCHYCCYLRSHPVPPTLIVCVASHVVPLQTSREDDAEIQVCSQVPVPPETVHDFLSLSHVFATVPVW